MTKRLLTALTVCLLAASGCNIIYKQNIQQGNAIEQEDMEQLRIGMSMNQVAFLLGTPAIRDPFHHDRWDYVSSFSRRGGEPVMRKVTLRFEAGALVEMIGVEDTLPDEEGVAGISEPGDSVEPEEALAEATGSTDEEEAATAIEPDSETTGDTAAQVVESAAVITAIDAPVADETAFSQPEPVEQAVHEAEAEVAAPAAKAAAVAEEAADTAATAVSELEPQDPALTGEAPGAWVVQLGAFDSRENAESLAGILSDAGVDAGIITQRVPDLGDRFLVRHGGLSSQLEAEALLERIKTELGVNGFVIPPS